MTTRTTCLRQEPRASLANPATMIVVAMITAMTFSASGAAPTPLYHLYQEQFALTPALVTVIFAAYVLSLLLALLMTGALSDHVGRRPTVLGALMLNIIAMVLFITAGSGAALIAARAVQGFATGVATAVLGAPILDVDQRRGAVLNSVTVFAGLTVGTLGAATLVTFAPDPAQLVYVVLLTLSGIEALWIWPMPETAQTKPGALTSLRPHVSIPIQARQTLAQLTPVTFASWAVGLLSRRLPGVQPACRAHRISGPDRRFALGRRRLRSSRDPDGGRVAGRNRTLSRESPSGCPGLTIGGWCRIHGWLASKRGPGATPKTSSLTPRRRASRAIC